MEKPYALFARHIRKWAGEHGEDLIEFLRQVRDGQLIVPEGLDELRQRLLELEPPERVNERLAAILVTCLPTPAMRIGANQLLIERGFAQPSKLDIEMQAVVTTDPRAELGRLSVEELRQMKKLMQKAKGDVDRALEAGEPAHESKQPL